MSTCYQHACPRYVRVFCIALLSVLLIFIATSSLRIEQVRAWVDHPGEPAGGDPDWQSEGDIEREARDALCGGTCDAIIKMNGPLPAVGTGYTYRGVDYTVTATGNGEAALTQDTSNETEGGPPGEYSPPPCQCPPSCVCPPCEIPPCTGTILLLPYIPQIRMI